MDIKLSGSSQARVSSIGIAQAASYIARIQRPDGEIPWCEGQKTDPWDHVESAMGLSVGGYLGESQRAFEWLAGKQLDDGSWYTAYRQGVAEYVQIVLDAFGEVERALLTRKQQLERRKREVKFLDEARATQRVAEERYIRGLVIYLDVLNAQITRFQAEENLALVDLAIMRNRVALHRALGGGWAKPEPVAVKDDGIFFNF